MFTLSSFMLKNLEKQIDVGLKDITLVDFPLYKGQHAYQGGKSTKTALVELVERVADALDLREMALLVFLDIEGVFGNTSFQCYTLFI